MPYADKEKEKAVQDMNPHFSIKKGNFSLDFS